MGLRYMSTKIQQAHRTLRCPLCGETMASTQKGNLWHGGCPEFTKLDGVMEGVLIDV